MTTCVVGLGKIGLPLAVHIAIKGEHVIGADINSSVVQQINSAEVPFPGESELPELLKEVIDNGYLVASTNTKEAVSQADHVVVVVRKVPRDDPLERGPVSRAARRRSVAPSFTLQGGSVRSHVAVVPSRGGLAWIVRVEVPVVGVLAHEPPAVVQAFAARGGRNFSL